MIFEGSEKKFEIILEDKEVNLRALSRDFWVALVKRSHAEIISSISSDKCDAYLLSESSLFVWSDRITMITCGQTTLVEAVKYFLSRFGLEGVACLTFQRKNEYFSHMQSTNFFDDVKELNKIMDGKAYRFGKAHEHHNYLYHLDVEYKSAQDDHTTELLMYDICEEASQLFMKPGQTAEAIREYMKMTDVLPGFEIDDFAFEPYGYSLNALKGDRYFTFHVTPQDNCSYVSFETNALPSDSEYNVLEHVLNVFKPASFDIIAFNSEIAKEFKEPEGYLKRTDSESDLRIGFNVGFQHYIKLKTFSEGCSEL